MTTYDQECCAFCLDYFEMHNKIEYNKIEYNKIESDQTFVDTCKFKLATFDNQNVKLNCNHIFHFKCFIEYLTYEYEIYYKNINTYFLENINFYNIFKCPICRTSVLKNTIYKILDKSNTLYKINSEVINKLNKLKYKISCNKFLIYSKFVFNKHCQIKNVHDINKMNIIHDEILLFKKDLDKYILNLYILKTNLKS